MGAVTAGLLVLGGIAFTGGAANAVVGPRAYQPWVVQTQGGCTGIALDPNWILTAAHCGAIAQDILFPSSDGTYGANAGARVTADYAGTIPSTDLALQHLSTPHPVASYPTLATTPTLPAGVTTGVIYGQGQPTPGELHSADVEINPSASVVTDKQGGPAFDVYSTAVGDVVQPGDSGSPLVVGGKVYGIASAQDWFGGGVFANVGAAAAAIASRHINAQLLGTATVGISPSEFTVTMPLTIYNSKARVMVWVNGRYWGETYNGVAYYTYTVDRVGNTVVIHYGWRGLTLGTDSVSVVVGSIPGAPGDTPPPVATADVIGQGGNIVIAPQDVYNPS